MAEPQPTIGYLAQVACTWEVLARKAGNVCPGREFADLTVNDFLASAAAIAPVLEQAPYQPLGVTILRCIEETRKVVDTNTNLGIVLLLAPLASVPLDQPLRRGVRDVLGRTTVEDSRKTFAAIRLARPGGLGDVKEQDVKGEPTLPLREVMTLAKDRDRIAAQYATDYEFLFEGGVPHLINRAQQRKNIEWAIVETQLSFLNFAIDSHVLRRHGVTEANNVVLAARTCAHIGSMDNRQGRQAFLDLDTFLRSDNHARNPGTTADMIAAALFVALREKQIALDSPFTWDDHPFSEPEALAKREFLR